MKLSHSPRRRRNDDGLIPLINVVFLMLLFFVLAGELLPPEAFEVRPPISANESSAGSQDVTVLAAADGRYAIDGQRTWRRNLPKLGRRRPGRSGARQRRRAD